MAEKPPKPCKRRKSDTLEAAVSAGLALLEEGKKSEKTKKQRQPVHFHFVKSGIIRQTHTPYRARAKARKDDLPQTSSAVEHNLLDELDEDSEMQMNEDIDEELERIISQCNELLESQPSKQRAYKTWSHRMADLQSSWEEGRSKIFEILVAGEFLPEGSLCSICFINPATIRCHQCGNSHILCHQCDRTCHSTKPFHDREAWFENHFEPIRPSQTVDENGQVFDADCFISFSSKMRTCFNCGQHNSFHAIPSKDMSAVFTMQGRFDVNSSTFVCNKCSCMSPLTLEDVLCNGYWPASPTTLTTLFSQDLFLTWDTFQKRMPGCSETSFIRSLEDVSLTKGRIGTINPRTFTKAFREWKYCRYELDILQSKDWLKCPCCSSNQHSCHVDGNMKLYRYKRSGSKKDESYYGDAFIASNVDVDHHLKKVYEHQNVRSFIDDGKCGETNWRAAGNKCKRYTHLDETGLEIAGCRHGLAQWAVNMFRGEIYGYANYIHIYKMIPNNVAYMWEDIICKYWKWANNIPGNGLKQQNMKPALSVMHAKAHNWSCQILWGGRWQEGAACSTGEEVEQINSYLSRISNTTKYMLPEYREELITEHAIAWNRRKILFLAESLFKRYAKTLKGLETTEKELDDALAAVKLKKDSVNAAEWKKDIQIVARELENHSLSKVTEEEELYLLSIKTSAVEHLLPNLSADRSAERDYLDKHLKKAVAKYATTEDKQRRLETLSGTKCVETSACNVMKKGQHLCLLRVLDTVQNELELLSFSIYQRKISIDKLAASSKARAKLRKKLSADQTQITKRTYLHNELQLALGVENLQPLNQSSIVDGLFPWTLNDISVRVKCKVVDKFEILKRHEEELDLIKKEIIRYLKYYKDIVPQMKSQISDLEVYLVQEISPSRLESRTPLVEADTKKIEYATTDERSKSVVMGEISLRWKGVQFAKQQLNIGLQTFACINDGNFDLPLEEDCVEDRLSDDDSMYDVDDDYIEKLIEDYGHGQGMIANWNEDAQIENEREVGGRYGEETGNGNNSEI